MMKRHKAQSMADIEHGLRIELRAILRQYDDLRSPLDRFERHPFRPETQPRFFVAFDRKTRHDINGLRVGIKRLVLPDERILDGVLRFAESVWHLKDRLRQFAKAKSDSLDVERIATESEALRICADLANTKKHGACEQRSGLNPRLGIVPENSETDGVGVVEFDTDACGVVELFYQGATKEKELLVTEPVPIPFRVDILLGDGKSGKRDAVGFIYDAFYRHWVPVIRELGLLESDDREVQALRSRLFVDAA